MLILKCSDCGTFRDIHKGETMYSDKILFLCEECLEKVDEHRQIADKLDQLNGK